MEVVVQSGVLSSRAYPLGMPSKRLFLGRHRTCDILFPTDQNHMMVGRFHAVIESRSDGVYLINLHSNGTMVNQTMVGEEGELRLQEGTRIQLGGEGPLIILRQVSVPPPSHAHPTAPVALLPLPPLSPPATASQLPSSGPSPQAQSLLQSFGQHLLDLNDSLEEQRDGAVPAQQVLDKLEILVSKLTALRSTLGIRSPG